MRYLAMIISTSVLALSFGSAAWAGTGTCKASNGGIIDGGKCCSAFGASGCTCDESNAPVNGIVTCTHIQIKDGDTRTLELVKPKDPAFTTPSKPTNSSGQEINLPKRPLNVPNR